MMDGSRPPHITYHADMVQGSDDWLAARCGLPPISTDPKPTPDEMAAAEQSALAAMQVTE